MSDPQKDAEAWEEHYRAFAPGSLPWDAGCPDVDLVRLVKSGTIPVGQALDIGTGLGHDAVFLIQNGFDVIGIDISPSAVVCARENASNHGLFGFFQVGDIRKIPVEDAFIDFAHDRGCFHVLEPEDRAQAVSEIARVLRKRGLYLVRVFSDKEPGTDGPHRFSPQDLEKLFQSHFKILSSWESVAQGGRKAMLLGCLMEKK